MAGYRPADRPDCTSQYYPGQGGSTASAYEPDGNPGQKEASPGFMELMASEEGYHDTSKLSAHATAHANPAIQAVPDNIVTLNAVGPQGAIDAGPEWATPQEMPKPPLPPKKDVTPQY